jgi:hypothetical protein
MLLWTGPNSLSKIHLDAKLLDKTIQDLAFSFPKNPRMNWTAKPVAGFGLNQNGNRGCSIVGIWTGDLESLLLPHDAIKRR